MQTGSVKNEQLFSFLKGGGEVGELIRNYNWNETSIGGPDKWPPCLRTTLNTLLNSKFPMFLYWGPELICFYNDATRPDFASAEKYTESLGKTGALVWPEAWPVIKPLMDSVLAGGKATQRENQLIPIYRNGRLEEAYWNFGYSPVYNEEGEIAGLLSISIETTENVKTINRLLLSDQRFQNLVRQATVGIVVLTGEEMRVDIVNEMYGKLIDRTPEELIDKPLFSIVPESEELFRPILNNVRLTGKPSYLYDQPYFVYINGHKKEGYLNLVYQPYREADGKIAGVMALCQDVTEQVRARKKLEESEQRVRSVVESAPFPIGVYVGKEMRIQLANQAIIDVWDKGNDVVGKLYSEILPELDNQEIFGQLDDVYTTGIPFHAKNQRVDLVVHGKLQSFYFNYSFTPLYDADGNVYGVMNTAAEVTDLHLANKKIEESEARFRQMADAMPQLVWTSDTSGNLNYYNQAVYDYSGLNYDQIQKDGWLQIVHPDDREENIKLWIHSMKTGEDFIFHHRFKNKDGDYRWQLSRAVPQRNSQGIIELWIGTSTNIHEHKLFEEELNRQVKERTIELENKNLELELINKELEQFTYAASHDMQEPLRKVRTFSSFLLENHSAQLDDKGKTYLTKISTSVLRMKTIIDDLLNYSHQTREAQEFSWVDLNKIAEDAEADLELVIQQKNAVVTKDPLPLINAVPAQMNQLFFNLFSNALKFSKPHVPVQIQIKCTSPAANDLSQKGLDEQKQYIKISFSDNGIGFNQQHAERIFSLFKRLHSKSEFEGTGIGLGLCKKIVLHHKGAIWAEAVPGKGATFHILLPK